MLDLARSDGKQYTLTLKDALLPKTPGGREQSTVSWEFDFEVAADGGRVTARWEDFKATYRGREKKDAEPLKLESIKRVTIMVRR